MKKATTYLILSMFVLAMGLAACGSTYHATHNMKKKPMTRGSHSKMHNHK